LLHNFKKMPGLTFLFFDISTGEILIILIVVFIVFGPSKIPELSKKIGRGIYEIKRASNEIKREIDTEVRKLEREVDLDKMIPKDEPPVKKPKAKVEPGSKENSSTKPQKKSPPQTKKDK